jgi:pimeloyl-ACP methyl ester carboxylesterase/DNA-binding CsgD family transcriptional regulator
MSQIRFCKSRDGVRIAYAQDGRGPAMIEVATWLNHVEYDWKSPIWNARLTELTRNYTLTRYDGRGCGLSDQNPASFTFEDLVADLEAVIEAAGLKQFILLGCCQGGPVAIAYAARHPERVSHLVLYGAYARGKLKRNPSQQDIDEAKTMLKLVELGWGRDNPAFRQVYTTLLIPDSKPEQYSWFLDMQRMTISAQNVVCLMRALDRIDISALLTDIRSPTLVLHARYDRRIPFEEGHRIAHSIPNAEFVPLEGRNHLLLEHQSAWRQFLDETARFVRKHASAETTDAAFLELTAREREVLDLIARGLDNAQIAKALRLSEKTIRNHINSIFGKLGTPNRAQAIVRAREAGLGAARSVRA